MVLRRWVCIQAEHSDGVAVVGVRRDRRATLISCPLCGMVTGFFHDVCRSSVKTEHCAVTDQIAISPISLRKCRSNPATQQSAPSNLSKGFDPRIRRMKLGSSLLLRILQRSIPCLGLRRIYAGDFSGGAKDFRTLPCLSYSHPFKVHNAMATTPGRFPYSS